MYNQNIISAYFNSDEYIKSEMSDEYLNLIMFLQNNLNEDLFLKCEELLHLVIIEKIEKAFLSGYSEGINYEQNQNRNKVI